LRVRPICQLFADRLQPIVAVAGGVCEVEVAHGYALAEALA
jgi:hypothetical protein